MVQGRAHSGRELEKRGSGGFVPPPILLAIVFVNVLKMLKISQPVTVNHRPPVAVGLCLHSNEDRGESISQYRYREGQKLKWGHVT